jgi:hypothetical protein
VTDATTCPALALFTATLVYILLVASHNTTSVQSVNIPQKRTVDSLRHIVSIQEVLRDMTGEGGRSTHYHCSDPF